MRRLQVVVHQYASVDGRLTLAPGVKVLGDERWQAVAASGSAVERLQLLHKPEVCFEGSATPASEDQRPEPLWPFECDRKSPFQDFLPDEVVHRPGQMRRYVFVRSGGRARGWMKQGDASRAYWMGWHILVVGSCETPSLVDSPSMKPNVWPTTLELISAEVQAEGHVWLRCQVVPEESKGRRQPRGSITAHWSHRILRRPRPVRPPLKTCHRTGQRKPSTKTA